MAIQPVKLPIFDEVTDVFLAGSKIDRHEPGLRRSACILLA